MYMLIYNFRRSRYNFIAGEKLACSLMEESTCHKMVIGQFEEICLYVCLFFERFYSFEYAFDIDGERTIIFDNESTSPADIL